jgi:hypothetical protein
MRKIGNTSVIELFKKEVLHPGGGRDFPPLERTLLDQIRLLLPPEGSEAQGSGS